MNAANMIVSAREAAGISQAELARRIGVPRSVMCVYEHGKREPGADTLLHIIAATGNELRVQPRSDRAEVERAGKILAQVIELAEALPYSPRRELGFPNLRDRLG